MLHIGQTVKQTVKLRLQK